MAGRVRKIKYLKINNFLWKKFMNFMNFMFFCGFYHFNII